MKYTYLLIDGLTILIPVVASFHPKIQFHKKFSTFFCSNAVAALLFITWDIYFTSKGVWGFNPNYVLGYYGLNLPFEEILFFVAIPFACLFTYYVLNRLYEIKFSSTAEHVTILTLSVALMMLGLCHSSKLYTSVTAISLSLILLFLKYRLKVSWLMKLIWVYPILLIPFFIVNGVLTGSGLEQAVVWYNNVENLNIRLGTIPVEDIFYGFELILINVFFYEYFDQKFNKEAIDVKVE